MKEIKGSADAGAAQSRAAHTNSSSERALMGRHNPNAPARLRRFT